MSDWDPARYGAFRDLRLRPALDLLARVGELPVGDVIDLGCGSGAVAAALDARFPGRVVGVDTSAAMLAEAGKTGLYRRLEESDIAGWSAQGAALIFSNAALQWLGDHPVLMPRLAGMLAPGGVLAVQMPRQGGAPSHRLLREVAERLFPGRFTLPRASVLEAARYAGMLGPLGDVQAWTTEYVQALNPVATGHPVRAFTESTAMRPFVERLSAGEADAFIAAYDLALTEAYHPLPSGGVLFPFTRVFFILKRD